MSRRAQWVSLRFVPLVALLLLESPLNWVSLVCHEGGHGVLALVQGGTFTGILITQAGSYAIANSSLVSIGGWMGQYALAIAALLVYWRIKPGSFLGKSVLVILIVQNLTSEPPYIASLQNDSAATLDILERTGIGVGPSTAILEITALALGLVGIYGAWRIFRAYFSSVFGWIGTRRARWASMIFVVGGAASTWLTNLVPTESALTNNAPFQLASFAAFLIIFSLFVIPPLPAGTRALPERGPAGPTVAFIVLLFVETQIVLFFVLPITIPFP